MATVTRELVQAFNASAKTAFDDAFQAERGTWQRLATVVPSTMNTEDYGWISQVPAMREWVDERTIKSLSEYEYSIRNKRWESTIAVDREVLEDEKHGQVRIQIESMAEAASLHYDNLIYALIRDNGLCYDGKAFFANDHPQGDGNTFDNLGAGALTSANLKAALTVGRRIEMDNGEPMMVAYDTLVVPPELEWTGRELLSSGFYPDQITGAQKLADNVLKGTLGLIVAPRLTSAVEWYLFDCSHPVKPFILQQRVAPAFQALDDAEASETAFLRDQYLYGVRARHNAGYGLPQYGYKSTGV